MKAITSGKDTIGAGRNSGGGVLSRLTQFSVVCCSISVPTLIVEAPRRQLAQVHRRLNKRVRSGRCSRTRLINAQHNASTGDRRPLREEAEGTMGNEFDSRQTEEANDRPIPTLAELALLSSAECAGNLVGASKLRRDA